MSRSHETELHRSVRDVPRLQRLLDDLGEDGSGFVLGRPEYCCSHDEHGQSGVLHCAVMGGCIDAVELLLNRGAVLDDRDAFGRTPLIQACSEGHEHIVESLIKHGADVHAQDTDGLNCVHWAYCMDHIDLGDWLLQHAGIDLSVMDGEGRTAQNWRAISLGDDDTMSDVGAGVESRYSKETKGNDDEAERDAAAMDQDGSRSPRDATKGNAFVINGEVNNFAAGSSLRAIKWLANNSGSVMCLDK